MHMKPYILLTPGPLTTSQTVKEAMLTDWCTWDEDYNLHIVEEIRKSLVSLATQHTGDYTSILLQGSGTYCVEAVIGSVIKPADKLLILSQRRLRRPHGQHRRVSRHLVRHACF